MDPTITAAIITPIIELDFSKANSIKSGIGLKLRKLEAANISNKIILNLRAIEFVKPIFRSERISINDFYYPSRIKSHASGKTFEVNNRSQLTLSQNAIILGTVGQGKSMLLRFLALNELSSADRIPVFLELRYVSQEKKVIDLIVDELQKIGFLDADEEIANHLLKSEKFTIFVDGIDEIKRANILSVKNECLMLMSKFKSTRFVFSSRPGSLSHLFQNNSALIPFYLTGISKDEIPKFLEKMGRNGESLDFLMKAINASPSDVKGVLNTPLMLTLLNYSFGGSAAIPNGLQEFYNSLFHILVSRHDLDKELFQRERATNLSNSDLQYFFECFSFIAKPYGVALNDIVFNKVCDDAAKVTRKDVTPEGFKTDVTESVCLMMPDGMFSTYIHKSIQEFFAASYIARQKNEEIAINLYRNLWSKSTCDWSVELDFLEKIDNENYLRFYLKPIYEDFINKFENSGEVNSEIVLGMMNDIIFRIKSGGSYYYFYKLGRYNPEFLSSLHDILRVSPMDHSYFEEIIKIEGVKTNLFSTRSIYFKKVTSKIQEKIVDIKKNLNSIEKKLQDGKDAADKYILGLVD